MYRIGNRITNFPACIFQLNVQYGTIQLGATIGLCVWHSVTTPLCTDKCWAIRIIGNNCKEQLNVWSKHSFTFKQPHWYLELDTINTHSSKWWSLRAEEERWLQSSFNNTLRLCRGTPFCLCFTPICRLQDHMIIAWEHNDTMIYWHHWYIENSRRRVQVVTGYGN